MAEPKRAGEIEAMAQLDKKPRGETVTAGSKAGAIPKRDDPGHEKDDEDTYQKRLTDWRSGSKAVAAAAALPRKP